jgi:hypothetical protein
MEVDNGEGRWCDGADEGVVVVGRCVRKREAGEGVWAEQPKPSRRDSISGALCEMAKGDGVEGWCGGVYEVAAVVGLCVREREAARGVWAKIRNRAVVARFKARRAKQRRGMVHRGGVAVRMRWWWWWWGCVLAKREAGRQGVWAKTRNPKPSRCGSI